jgi:hypothetical protein
MANIIKILRSLTTGVRPAGHAYGEPYVNLADNQFGVVGSGGAGQDLIGVPYFSTTATYSAGQCVNHGNQLWVATGAVAAGAWNAAQWSPVATQTSFSGRNMVMNGDMRLDQRTNGTGIPNMASGVYVADRWYYGASQPALWNGTGAYTGYGSPPGAGFPYTMTVNVSTALAPAAGDYSYLQHAIEGFNIHQLQWGTAAAKPVTLSFWVYGNVAGTHSGALVGAAAYPFSFTIPTINTWTFVVITIPGATTGTWATDNAVGVYVRFNLGSGTTYLGPANAWVTGGNLIGATGSVQMVTTHANVFTVTGVQLEIGGVATPFERRPIGAELNLCRRYYQRYTAPGASTIQFSGYTTAGLYIGFLLPVAPPMRAAPTFSFIGTWVNTNCSGPTAYADKSIVSLFITATATGAAYTYNPANGGFDLNADI